MKITLSRSTVFKHHRRSLFFSYIPNILAVSNVKLIFERGKKKGKGRQNGLCPGFREIQPSGLFFTQIARGEKLAGLFAPGPEKIITPEHAKRPTVLIHKRNFLIRFSILNLPNKLFNAVVQRSLISLTRGANNVQCVCA